MIKLEVKEKIKVAVDKFNSINDGNKYRDYIYKDYIFELMLYKYLSDQQIEFLKENDFTEEDIKNLTEKDTEVVEYIQRNIGYYISYNNLFSTWIEIGRDFYISNVTDALSAFNRLIYKYQKNIFYGIFDTLHTRLSKLGELTVEQTRVMNKLLYLIKDIKI